MEVVDWERDDDNIVCVDCDVGTQLHPLSKLKELKKWLNFVVCEV